MDKQNQSSETSQHRGYPPLFFGQRIRTVVIVSLVIGLLFAVILIISFLRVPPSQVVNQTSSIPTTAPSPTASDADMANWKTYTEIITGFSMKYPNNWNQLGLPDGDIYLTQIALTPQSSTPQPPIYPKEFPEPVNGITMVVFKIKNCTNSAEYAKKEMNEYLQYKDELYPDLDIRSLDLNNIDGYVIYKGSPGVSPQKGPEVYIFRCPYEIQVSFDPTEIENSEELFDQILSTFRFTD